MTLSGSCDTKTSPAIVREAKGYKARISNAFGTMPGSSGTCALFATPACDASASGYCYVPQAFRYPAVAALLERNTGAVLELACAERWTELADAYYVLMVTSARQQQRAGIARPLYRHRWSGDVVNTWDARALTEASMAVFRSHGMRSWIYTRHLAVVPILKRAEGLRVLISADDDNFRAVESFAALYPDVQVAYVSTTHARPASAERTARALVCPAARRGNVVPARTSPTGLAGICSVCRACVDTVATPDIVFVQH